MERKILQKVKEYIEKYHMIASGDVVVAGVSGGADSVCLFLMLYGLAEEMGFRLTVVHVNHGIRREAEAEAAYVEGLCSQRGIPFMLAKEDVKAYAKRERLSEEEAGRKVRYEAFEDALKKYGGDTNVSDGMEKGRSCGKIAVAHNANDRAETMLFHLFRGTGLTGAGGIKPVRGNVIRPLLCLRREEIEEYLGKKRIAFCIDRTNLEDTYTRNRIRNHIIPYAEKEICLGAVKHMCGAADLFWEADAYIRRQAEKLFADCAVCADKEKIVLNVKKLEEGDPFIRKQVFLQCIEMLTEGRKDITSAHVEEVVKLLPKQGSKQISMPYGLKVRKEYELLLFYLENRRGEAEQGTLPEEIAVNLPDVLEKVYKLDVPNLGRAEFTVFSKEKIPIFLNKSEIISEKTCTEWLDCDKITKAIVFRKRKIGDYLTINKELSRKKLKDYMIEEKIPKSERGNLYVLADGSHIIWVPRHRISEYYKITEKTKYVLKVQLRGGL